MPSDRAFSVSTAITPGKSSKMSGTWRNWFQGIGKTLLLQRLSAKNFTSCSSLNQAAPLAITSLAI